MDIQYTGQNTEVTDAMREFTQQKLTKLNHFSESIYSIQVTFNINNMDQIAEAKITVPGQTIHAKSSDHDLYTAIDLLADKLIIQLRKYKEKNAAKR